MISKVDTPSWQVDENRWIDSGDVGKLELESIFEQNIITILKDKELID